MGETAPVEIPEIGYARSGDIAIAYQVVGSGGADVVFLRGVSGDLLSTWEQPLLVRHLERLAAENRLLLLDRRGSGLSDRVRYVPSLETLMDDVRVVLDAVGSEQAVLWTGLASTGVGVLFAATYPDRCSGLILLDPQAKGTGDDDYPWAPTAEEWRGRLRAIGEQWGERPFLERVAQEWVPSRADDPKFVDWLVWHFRRSLSPGAALTAYRMQMDADVTDVLSAVRVPTLVLQRCEAPEPARHVADLIRGAQVVELPPSPDLFVWTNEAVHDVAMEAMLGFIRSLAAAAAAPTRVLATVLFTDIVGSTATATRLGDFGWRQLLARHHALVRRELARFHGSELDNAGDGFFAAFDGPARAVRAARAICDAVREFEIEVRAGVHTGECEVHEGKLTGVAVAIGARISSFAGPGEVLVSSTVRDLSAGSGLRFEPRGTHELKGVDGVWSVFSVTEAGA